jgi:uncharacterized SAM-binding protein YcdF (DUF218 family)
MAPILFIVKAYLVPGSPMFLIIAIGVGLALLARPRLAAWGRRWLVAVAVSHAVLAVPVVSGLLQRGLGRTSPIRSAAEAGGARTIVVLGTGVVTVGPGAEAIDLPSVSTASNIAEAARLYRLLGGPRVIASGGIPPGGAGERPEAQVMRPFLRQLGVADADITLEPTSINTLQQAHHVAAMLPRGTPVVLVTVPTHMPRAAGLFRAQGLTVVPAVSDSTEPEIRTWMAPVVPNRYALRGSEMALYELLALTYYGVRGDLK